MRRIHTLGYLLLILFVMGSASGTFSLTSTQSGILPHQSTTNVACTAFCLDNGDHCLFGANFDNDINIGLLYVNKRNVSKTTWDPSISGEYARWVSRYGSVTVNLIGYQMVWGGMNEAGLMISTMSLPENETPLPDERPPILSPFWMQYQLDVHSTVEQVIASDVDIRIASPSFDHYLVCDRTGECAAIEFIEGVPNVHTGDSLPVKALTNSTYADSIHAWEEGHLNPEENSLWRFAITANRNLAFEPSNPEGAVEYAFETLKMVTGENTVWSFVYDPDNLRLYFHTNHNPQIRSLDFASLDFSCRTPVQMLDVHANLSGDISGALIPYNHAVSFTHTNSFVAQFEGVSMSPVMVDALLWGVESFPCQDSSFVQTSLQHYQPKIPLTVLFAGQMVLHRVGPIWVLLTGFSLVILIWRLSVGGRASLSQWLIWVLVTVFFGPFGLLAFLIAQRKVHRAAEVA